MKRPTTCFNQNSLMASFNNAFKGILQVFKYEQNMRIHVILAIIVIILGVLLNLSKPEWILIILCIGLVFTVEIINTAVERLVDLLSPEKKALAGKAKDIAAGAVLISVITAAIVGLIVFIPHFVV